MKLASFMVGQRETYGLKVETGIIDSGKRLADRYADLRALIEHDGLDDARRFIHATPDYQESDVDFLPVIKNPHKIFCVGMNYAEKRIEFGAENPAPTLFIRFPDSQVGHNCGVIKPVQSNEFDYEGELAVIIGKKAKRSRLTKRFLILPDTVVIWMARYATGSIPGLPPVKTGKRPGHLALGW